MLTASGDQCVHLWDTASAQGLGQFRGHNGSVKSVSPSSDGQPIFASGARLPDHACPMCADHASDHEKQARSPASRQAGPHVRCRLELPDTRSGCSHREGDLQTERSEDGIPL